MLGFVKLKQYGLEFKKSIDTDGRMVLIPSSSGLMRYDYQ